MPLDLTAAFDTIIHSILISRQEHCVGIKGTILALLRCYLTDVSMSALLTLYPSQRLSLVESLRVLFLSQSYFPFICSPYSLFLESMYVCIMDSDFKQINSLSKVKSCLTFTDFEKVIHAFSFSFLNFCNALYVSVSHASLSRLQLVQNPAARLLTQTCKQ